MENEIWRDIKGYDGLFQVSNTGKVFGNARMVGYRGGRLKNWPARFISIEEVRLGYLRVKLHVNGKSKHHFVHRLVAGAFIPNPELKPFINHIDGNPKNNIVCNLEWCTASENELHSHHVLGKKTHFEGKPSHTRRPVIGYAKDGSIARFYEFILDAKKDGFLPQHISHCASGKRKTHKSLTWKYA